MGSVECSYLSFTLVKYVHYVAVHDVTRLFLIFF
jgi:hypothetical protein